MNIKNKIEKGIWDQLWDESLTTHQAKNPVRILVLRRVWIQFGNQINLQILEQVAEQISD